MMVVVVVGVGVGARWGEGLSFFVYNIELC